jgi:hypothetical protein
MERAGRRFRPVPSAKLAGDVGKRERMSGARNEPQQAAALGQIGRRLDGAQP